MLIPADNQFIQNRILNIVAVLEKIPALRTLKQQIDELKGKCAGCQGDRDAQRKLDAKWNEVRTFLANLSPENREFIRTKAQISSKQRVRIAYREGVGKDSKVKSGEL